MNFFGVSSDLILYSNTLYDYFDAAVLFLLSLTILKVFKVVLISRIDGLAQKTSIDLDDMFIDVLENIGWPFYVGLSLYIGTIPLTFSSVVQKGIDTFAYLVFAYYSISAIEQVIKYVTKKVTSQREGDETTFDPAVIKLVTRLSKIILWSLAIIVILQNLGYKVSALLAGLGVGGIAVAFALQSVLEDIFAYFAIFFDRPFEIGDFVIFGDKKGTVKKVGIKTTRLETLEGDELVVSNTDLTTARVHNYKKMDKRRVITEFGIVYETSLDKVKKVPDMIKKIIKDSELAEVDRVHFKEFGDSALIYEMAYLVDHQDYKVYMDVQQGINFKIMDGFKEEGIEFAYPTRKVFLDKGE